MTAISTDEVLRKILKRDCVIAVVGLSDKRYRPSYEAAAYMQQNGNRIVPLNSLLAATTVRGEPVHASLADARAALAAQGVEIGMVGVFRKSADLPPVADAAIKIAARSVWLQLGVVHGADAGKARAAGLDFVADRCVKIEHRRLFA
ncbi:CoA-binding protein [Burkholderia sp. MSMB2042]|nr:CoA-binding protein [Burkholderia savannae]KVG47495.1 CoA-binding protein [Burkholderia sp. MSMB0265]KVG82448.1 CoA-binding protein [Burkholderia sp. MSMB2040]KVG92690.1 CoA-binding protein [Burkholderia sp. MSMB2041]KVG98549.1 CoA-binding protein [Burkholderia sp. MSMB2042]